MGKTGRDHSAAATAKRQPECSDRFGGKFVGVLHDNPPLSPVCLFAEVLFGARRY
jgi:hypothetical protein